MNSLLYSRRPSRFVSLLRYQANRLLFMHDAPELLQKLTFGISHSPCLWPALSRHPLGSGIIKKVFIK